MSLVEEKLSTPVVDSADVLVVGGGVAGVAAAVAARRQGADVMILEKTALFGGLATNGLISWYEPLCDGQGTQLIMVCRRNCCACRFNTARIHCRKSGRPERACG